MEEEAQQQEPSSVEKLQTILSLDNVAEYLEETELARIGHEAVADYKIDRSSMKGWLDRMERGIELASMVKEDKTYPFPKAANVKYPLVTTAALQFNARAYPAIVAAEGVVKAKTFGQDPQGVKAALGERVSEYMSWQLLSEIEEWEEDTDKILVQLPIVGTMFRKVWYDPTMGRVRCRVVAPGALILNDKVKSLAEAPRITEEISLYPDEIASRRLSGFYRDLEYREEDSEDRSKPEDFIEQHCRLDLDGDGYEEPYVVVVHKKSEKVARIAADFEAEDVGIKGDRVVRIKRGTYFVAYHFLPAMDGGFFGVGFGLLLGDISETVNSIINMMMDAGHMASLGGGFIGSEFRIKGGSQTFRPGEWKNISAKGADVRQALVPLTFPGPDNTLFSLLGLLIDAGKEVASVKDVMTGDTGGRSMTATTTLALIEQGMAVFSASYKRIFRALKQEYKLLAKINAQTVSVEQYNAFHDERDPQGQQIIYEPAQEFSMAGMDIEPVADPRSVTKMQQAAKAQILMELSAQGVVDRGEATRRILEATEIQDTEELSPKPDPMQQQMGQIGLQAAQADAAIKMVEIEKLLAEIDETKSKTMKNLSDATAQQQGVRIDETRMRLEAIRDGLAQLIGARPGGMAGAPGNQGTARGPQGVGGNAAGSGPISLLGGQGMAGSGAPGIASAGGPYG